MYTMSRVALRTNAIINAIHNEAFNTTHHEWKKAVRRYYTQGYDNGETTRLYKELAHLGADMDELFDEDFAIREEVEEEKAMKEEEE